MIERTFVMIKPDGVVRRLIGEIISTFEVAGLRVVRLEMVHPTREVAERHYPSTREWLVTAGKKALDSFASNNSDLLKEIGTEDPLAIGHIIKDRLVSFLCSASVVIMILEGNQAIVNTRRLIGDTIPTRAGPSTIRGRYSIDSPDLSFVEQRPVLNLVHASGTAEEAEFEINLWFDEDTSMENE